MPQGLFRHRHPVLTGLLVLGALVLFFWGGIAFFVSRIMGPSQAELFAHEGIGIVELKGIIVESEDVVRTLVEFREDDKVKAIVLRVDSPGGAVGASQEIHDEVLRTAKTKPVVASMGSVAASGGLYASLGATKVMANAGTMTGSMGVILKFANLEGLFQKVGYRSEVVKSGKLKDIGSSDRPMTEEERKMLQGLIDSVHDQFVQAAVSGRSLPEEKVRAFADGRVFSGQQAKEFGLVDQLGNFTDAVMLAATLAGMSTDKLPELLYPSQKKFSILGLLTGEQGESLLRKTIFSGPVPAYEWTGSLR